MSMQGLPSHCGHPLQLTDTKDRGGSTGEKLFLTFFLIVAEVRASGVCTVTAAPQYHGAIQGDAEGLIPVQ